MNTRLYTPEEVKAIYFDLCEEIYDLLRSAIYANNGLKQQLAVELLEEKFGMNIKEVVKFLKRKDQEGKKGMDKKFRFLSDLYTKKYLGMNSNKYLKPCWQNGFNFPMQTKPVPYR